MLRGNSSVRLFNWFNIRKVTLVTFATQKKGTITNYYKIF